MPKNKDKTDPTYNIDYPSTANGAIAASSIQSVYEEEEEAREDPLLCGYGSCTPRWLQRFHNAKSLLFMLGACAFIQSFVVNSIFPVGLSTIERRFHMTSTQTGIISSVYDFAIMLAVFPVCHWGNIGHKGRWIGMGTFIMGIGSIVCALPHYFIAPYEPELHTNSSDFGQCLASDPEPTKCLSINEESSSYLNPYFLLFILGQILHGVGSTPLFSIGTAYLDENVSQKASPVYLAIHAVVTSVGPVIGLFVGGFLLNIYDDFDRVDVSKITMKSSDPRWIGAWWLGFLGSAVAAFLNAFPILMFARELPEAKRHRQKDVNQMHVASAKVADDSQGKSNLKSMPKQILNLLRNPTFVTTIVLGIFEAIIINGFAAFMPKILETILSVTPATAAYLSSLVIFAAAAGVLIGGILIRRMNLQVPGMLKMILVCHVIALLLILSFFIQCPGRDFVGITTGYSQEHQKPSGHSALLSQCNSDCHCKKEWNPVCDTVTGQIYYNPCFAACTEHIKTEEGDIWTGCQCLNSTYIDSDLHFDSKWDANLTLTSGFCSKACGWPMWLFLTLLFFSVVASFASGIPTQQIMLRVVPFHQRALAISVSWTFLRLLGFIPGGVLFGLIIDTSCLKWKESACGTKQSCLVHDQHQLSWTIMIVAVVCKLVSILAAIIGYMTYKPTDLDSSASIQTTDSRGPLSLTVNDDRLETTPKPMANGRQAKRVMDRNKILA